MELRQQRARFRPRFGWLSVGERHQGRERREERLVEHSRGDRGVEVLARRGNVVLVDLHHREPLA